MDSGGKRGREGDGDGDEARKRRQIALQGEGSRRTPNFNSEWRQISENHKVAEHHRKEAQKMREENVAMHAAVENEIAALVSVVDAALHPVGELTEAQKVEADLLAGRRVELANQLAAVRRPIDVVMVEQLARIQARIAEERQVTAELAQQNAANQILQPIVEDGFHPIVGFDPIIGNLMLPEPDDDAPPAFD